MMTFALQHLQSVTAGVFVKRNCGKHEADDVTCFGCATGGAE